MTEPNRKRYVYLDKYLDFQNSITSKMSKIDSRISILTYVMICLIGITTYVLYKIFE